MVSENRTRKQQTPLFTSKHQSVVLTVVISILFFMIPLIVLRIEVLGAVLLAITVLPIMTFARNEGKQAADGDDTENELFHVAKFQS